MRIRYYVHQIVIAELAFNRFLKYPSRFMPLSYQKSWWTLVIRSLDQVITEMLVFSDEMIKSTPAANDEQILVKASKLDPVRSSEPTHLSSKRILVAVVVILVSVLWYLIQQKNWCWGSSCTPSQYRSKERHVRYNLHLLGSDFNVLLPFIISIYRQTRDESPYIFFIRWILPKRNYRGSVTVSAPC